MNPRSKKRLLNFIEEVVQLFGFTLIAKRQHKVFTNENITPQARNNLEKGLDRQSLKVIDSLFYINNNKHKLFAPRHKVHLYTKFYDLSKLSKLLIKKKYQLNANNKDILSEVFKYHCGLKFISPNTINNLKNKSAITAGASWGDSCLVFSNYVDKVFGFEPNQYNLDKLNEIITKNHLNHKVSPFPLGLSDKKENLFFDDENGLAVSSKFVENTNGKPLKKLELTDIDSFVKQQNINNLGIIHLDIEGFEYKAIAGAKQTIKKHKPVLLISIYHNQKDFFEIKPLIESWNLGYTFKIRKLLSDWSEIMIIAEAN